MSQPPLLPTPALRGLADRCRLAVAGNEWPSDGTSDVLEDLARRHRVTGLFAASCGDREGVEALVAANLALLSEYRLLKEALHALHPIFLKGLPISALGYRQPLLKQSADVDILIDCAHAEEAADCLQSIGYRLSLPSRRLSLPRWYRVSNQSVWQSDRGAVELHVRPLTIPFTIEAPTQAVSLGSGVTVETLGEADLYPYLVLHGALSGWFRLKWLVDLYAYLSHRTEFIGDYHRIAVERGMGAASAAALILLSALFDLSSDAADREDATGYHLASLGLGLLEGGEPTQSRLGTLAIHRSRALVHPGPLASVARLRDLIIQRWLD